MSLHVSFTLHKPTGEKFKILAWWNYTLAMNNTVYSLRSFTALAFVPEDKVVEFFKHLSDSVPQDAPTWVHEFIDYIAETYVGHEVYERTENQGEGLVHSFRRVPRWKDPKFSPKLWYICKRVLNDEPRTTNMLEGWHRRFSTVVAKHYPNMCNFISCLRAEQARTETVTSKLVISELPKVPRKMEKSKNERIKNCTISTEGNGWIPKGSG